MEKLEQVPGVLNSNRENPARASQTPTPTRCDCGRPAWYSCGKYWLCEACAEQLAEHGGV